MKSIKGILIVFAFALAATAAFALKPLAPQGWATNTNNVCASFDTQQGCDPMHTSGIQCTVVVPGIGTTDAKRSSTCAEFMYRPN